MSTVLRHLAILLSIATAACAGSSTPPVAPTTPQAPPAAEVPAPQPPPSGPPTWDVEANGIPRFITADYLDLGRIAAVSRFRSGEGHDYSDAIETCRSMKHYFRPASPSSARTIPIYAPVAGRVAAVVQEWAGAQIVITSSEVPAFRVILFHVNPSIPVAEGTLLESGQVLGTHIGEQTWSDVAVAVDTPQGFKLVSWFEAIADPIFERYRARGLARREDAIITRDERDRAPLSCTDGAFASRGTIENWVSLR